MIKTYSRRLLSPFVGVVQIAEMRRARALSLDGRNWEIQCASVDELEFRRQNPGVDPKLRFFLVATLESGELKIRGRHPLVKSDAVREAMARLQAAVSAARLPFAAADDEEYWLLDPADDRPLALLHTCVAPEERDLLPRDPSWVAMSASQLAVPDTERPAGAYVPPVNYRLERAVEKRAGARPRACWMRRGGDGAVPGPLPPCLLREDWLSEEQQDLYRRYVHRLAPRLLMLHDLPRETRRGLEVAACDHALDVARFHSVYPEVVDEGLIKVARVEAELRKRQL